MAKQMWYTQEILFKTYLPKGNWAKGREYFFMKDIDGTIYIANVDENGQPDIL